MNRRGFLATVAAGLASLVGCRTPRPGPLIEWDGQIESLAYTFSGRQYYFVKWAGTRYPAYYPVQADSVVLLPAHPGKFVLKGSPAYRRARAKQQILSYKEW